ncbi:hypothetical protein J2Z31_000767 [Sinorhizobium kostiense]|uniref:DUF982 domain-containing protein n=1 Tax=Sinorhizobium kostiense TaxID=76747 RepID=A0ABS4QUE5_9HYPH|nr:DUF982 domain-containing protein [Sinorhizobium kostiense]MBP2234277.1 hypothetical protein [Sinorhizobium kostiense]
MDELPWSEPVIVTLLNGRRRCVVGPLDARTCLQREWPLRQGEYYSSALRACNAALKHQKKPEEARAAFLAAAREAFLAIASETKNPQGHILRTPR